MSVSNDIDWTTNGNSLGCISNSKEVRDYAKRFQRGHWSFLGPGNEEKWYETCCRKPEGKCDTEADQMILSTSNKVVKPYSKVQVRSTEEH